MRSSKLILFILAISLPHIIAISNNSPTGIDLGQDPAWGSKNWNTDGEALQEGLMANADGYDLAFANGQTSVTSSDSTDTSFSKLAATPNECENHQKQERLKARARRQRRNPENSALCPVKLETPNMQPSDENTENSGGSSIEYPQPWPIPVPEPNWAGYSPTCFTKTHGLLPLAVCDSSPYQLPSSYNLHGEPNPKFSQPQTWESPRQPGDLGPQPTQLGIDLNNPKTWQLNQAWLANPLATSCGAGLGKAIFWCCKKFTHKDRERPGKTARKTAGKADICLTLDRIDQMEANGEFKS